MKTLYTLILFTHISFWNKAYTQIVNIPDTNFYNALIANDVHDSAGYITVDTARAFYGELDLNGSNISDLTGIEAFTNIHFLDCSRNNLTTLNLSSNKDLVYLDCGANRITSLDLSSNTILNGLFCYNNSLTSLNLSSNIDLAVLNIILNQLTSLNLSSNISLGQLACNNNNLSSLDLSFNSALTQLTCSQNNLTNLNVKNGNNHNMTGAYFDATNNPLLTCIQVDDTVYSDTAWTNKDSTAHFSTNCNHVGIDEIKANADIRIYPNPVSSQLTIETNELKTVTINIYDAIGKLIYSQKYTGGTITININSIPEGVYLLQIAEKDRNAINRKIMKQ